MNKNIIKIPTKVFLYQEYTKNKKSIHKIAIENNCSDMSIYNRLKKFNISRRTLKEAHKPQNHYNFKDGRSLKLNFCIDCGMAIDWRSNRCRSCSKKGDKSNNYIDGRCSEHHFCINCHKKIGYSSWIVGQGRCKSCANTGKNHPNWRGGSSLEPYPKKWNETYRESIRIRDNHQCQICGKLEGKRKLSVHHIDYNKDNVNSENLISLCQNCHLETNFNRDIYIEFFRILKEEVLCF